MKRNRGFTLVELVVVITILAILSTIGFVSYVDYLQSVRDSSRIQQMSELQNAIELYAAKSRIPLSNDIISLYYEDNHIGYQGDIDQGVLDKIRYSDGGKDPKTKAFFQFMTSSDRKSSQILGFFEEQNNLLTSKQAIAQNEYDTFYPRVIGDELGIMLDSEHNTPIHKVSSVSASGSLDVSVYSGSLASYLTNSKIITGEGKNFISLIPGLNCLKIKKILPASQSKVYKINPSGSKPIDVYCDMETDGGGWTFVSHVDNDTNGTEIYFNAAKGRYSKDMEDTHEYYSLKMDDFYHSEMMVLYDTPDVNQANASNKLLIFRYDVLNPIFYSGPLIPCIDPQDSYKSLEYKTSANARFKKTTSVGCNSQGTSWSIRPTPHNGLYILSARNYISGDGNGTGFRYAPAVWDPTSTQHHSWGHDAWIFVR